MNIQWLKLYVNIIDDEKTYIMHDRSDGDKLYRLWIGMLCLGMKSSRAGVLLISETMPYKPETLAARLRLDRGVVEKGIELFHDLQMIEICDGAIVLSNFEKRQNLDAIARRREVSRLSSQKFRDRQKKGA